MSQRHAFPDSALRRRPRQAFRRVLCLHVLSSFQRTGRIVLLTLRSPPRLSSSGEPSNLTRRFHFVSTPGHVSCRVVFFDAPTRSRRSAAPNNGWGCDLKDCVRGKKICSGWTLANLPTPLVGSRSVHSIYAQRRVLSTLDTRVTAARDSQCVRLRPAAQPFARCVISSPAAPSPHADLCVPSAAG
jgi:hypothetical protein